MDELVEAILQDRSDFSLPEELSVDLNAPVDQGKTLLEIAVRRCKFRAAQRLVDLGADVCQPLSSGSSVLLLALQIESGLEFARSIFDRATLLPGHLEPAPNGESCLTWAAFRGALDLVEGCLRKGANVNAANKSGVTPLIAAASALAPDCVDCLLAAGADPMARTVADATAVETAREALHAAAGGDLAARKTAAVRIALSIARARQAAESRAAAAAVALLAENDAAATAPPADGTAHGIGRSGARTGAGAAAARRRPRRAVRPPPGSKAAAPTAASPVDATAVDAMESASDAGAGDGGGSGSGYGAGAETLPPEPSPPLGAAAAPAVGAAAATVSAEPGAQPSADGAWQQVRRRGVRSGRSAAAPSAVASAARPIRSVQPPPLLDRCLSPSTQWDAAGLHPFAPAPTPPASRIAAPAAALPAAPVAVGGYTAADADEEPASCRVCAEADAALNRRLPEAEYLDLTPLHVLGQGLTELSLAQLQRLQEYHTAALGSITEAMVLVARRQEQERLAP